MTWLGRFVGLGALSVLPLSAACSPATSPTGGSGETGGASSGAASGSGGSDVGSGGAVAGSGGTASGGDTGSGGNGSGGTASGGDTGSGGNSSGGTASGGTGPDSGAPGSGGSSGAGTGGGGSGGSSALPAFDAGPDSLNQVTAGAVCQRIAQIQCAAQEHCCAQAHSSRDTCITTQTQGCVDGGLDYITQQSRDAFDAAGAPAIIKTFEDRAAACDPTVAVWAATSSGLRGLVKGTLTSGADCTAGLTTDVKVVASYLAACSNADTTACLPHQISISYPTGKWTCAPLSKLGENCFTDLNCDQTADPNGVYCTNDINAPIVSDTWKCTARKETGASCQSSNQCLTLLCTRGATSKNPGVCLDATVDNAYCIN